MPEETHDVSVPARTAVAVVGGGVVGLFAALYLSEMGATVTVLDRGAMWSDASGANAGTISVQNKRLEVVPLTRLAIALWGGLSERFALETGYARPGGLRVAADPAGRDRLHRDVGRQRVAGLTVDILEGNSLRVFAPWLGDTVLAASYCDEDSYASPLVCGVALRTLLAVRGVVLCPHAPVTRIARMASGFSVETAAGRVRAEKVLIAAGPWSAAIAGTLGATVPLGADVNMLSATEPGPQMIDRVVTHVDGILSLKQYANGTCLIGGGWQGRGDYQSGLKELDYENLLHNMRTATAVLPSLARLTLLRSWSGFEAVAPDALPVFGQLADVGEAYIVAGARGAYSQGPALGLEVARLMTHGETELNLAPFTPARFGA